MAARGVIDEDESASQTPARSIWPCRRACRRTARLMTEHRLLAALEWASAGARSWAPGSLEDRLGVAGPALAAILAGTRAFGAARLRRNTAFHAAGVPPRGFKQASLDEVRRLQKGHRLFSGAAAAGLDDEDLHAGGPRQRPAGGRTELRLPTPSPPTSTAHPSSPARAPSRSARRGPFPRATRAWKPPAPKPWARRRTPLAVVRGGGGPEGGGGPMQRVLTVPRARPQRKSTSAEAPGVQRVLRRPRRGPLPDQGPRPRREAPRPLQRPRLLPGRLAPREPRPHQEAPRLHQLPRLLQGRLVAPRIALLLLGPGPHQEAP